MNQKKLFNILSNHFTKFSLLPVILIELALLIMYFSTHYYITNTNFKYFEENTISSINGLMAEEAERIKIQFKDISRLAAILQYEHEKLFKDPNQYLIKNKPDFDIAPNGVFFKKNKAGSSLYYSSKTKIGKKAKRKALFTEAMDKSFKSIVDNYPLIIAAYFNTFDDMNRLYPFIDEVYNQYGAHIHMEDYNFYYLADSVHNPEKKTVWTEPYLDPAGNGWMISCIVPIYNGEFLEGVTGLDITISSLIVNMLNTNIPYEGEVFIVDEKGKIVAMTDKISNILGIEELKEHKYEEAIKQTITKPEEFNILTSNHFYSDQFRYLLEEEETERNITINNEEYLSVQQAIPETNWSLIALIEQDKMFGHINSLEKLSKNIGYAAILVMSIFYAVFFLFLARNSISVSKKITQPLESLAEYSSKIGKNEQTALLMDTQIQEISLLGNNIQKMIREIDNNKTLLLETEQKHSKELEDKIEQRTKELKSANESLNKLFSIISHDLKGPMGSLSQLFNNIISKPSDFDEKVLHLARTTTKNTFELLEELLYWSRYQNKNFEYLPSNFAIEEIIEECIVLLKSSAVNKNIELAYSASNNQYVYADKSMTKTVIRNLLNNAIKFTEEGGKITISTDCRNAVLEVSIEDNGIGIPENIRKKMFQSNIQINSTPGTNNEVGTGLGLVLCHEFVTKNNGEIGVESEANKGSRFWFTLPAIEIEEEIKIKSRHLPDWVNSVLLAEDNTLHLQSSIHVLNHFDVNVSIAKDGLSAVSLSREKDFDLVLMDVNMPKMNGFEATEAIRSFGRNPIIIAVTSLSQEEITQLANIPQFDSYLYKPLTTDSLLYALHNLDMNTFKKAKPSREL